MKRITVPNFQEFVSESEKYSHAGDIEARDITSEEVRTMESFIENSIDLISTLSLHIQTVTDSEKVSSVLYEVMNLVEMWQFSSFVWRERNNVVIEKKHGWVKDEYTTNTSMGKVFAFIRLPGNSNFFTQAKNSLGEMRMREIIEDLPLKVSLVRKRLKEVIAILKRLSLSQGLDEKTVNADYERLAEVAEMGIQKWIEETTQVKRGRIIGKGFGI